MRDESDLLSDDAVSLMLAYSSDLQGYKGSFDERVTKQGYFRNLVYDYNWVLSGYSWTKQGDLLRDDMHIAEASLNDIWKAFTYAVRSDRFFLCVWGNLVTLFRVGVIQKLLNRLEVIHQSLESVVACIDE